MNLASFLSSVFENINSYFTCNPLACALIFMVTEHLALRNHKLWKVESKLAHQSSGPVIMLRGQDLQVLPDPELSNYVGWVVSGGTAQAKSWILRSWTWKHQSECFGTDQAKTRYRADQLQSSTAWFFPEWNLMHIRSLVRVMVLWQEKWVTFLEAAHSVAIICTPWALGIFTGLAFIKKTAQESCVDLFLLSLCFMLTLYHKENLKYISVCLMNWLKALFTKKYRNVQI